MIKNCPFCGSSDTHIVYKPRGLKAGGECFECGAKGPIERRDRMNDPKQDNLAHSQLIALAADRWNERTAI